MIKYEVIVYWSDEDETCIARVPELLGCLADSESYQGALGQVMIIIAEWLETANVLRRPILQPKGKLMYA